MYQLAPLLLHFHQWRNSFRMHKSLLGVLLFRRKLLLSSWGIYSQLHSLHLTRSFERRKVYILLWIWRLLIWCWELSISLLLFFPGESWKPVIIWKIFFPQNHPRVFLTGLFYYRCFDICWEILRHLLSIKAPNTFYASIQACYFDGVDDGYPVFHGLCPTFLEPNGVVQFPVFIRLISSPDYLRPQHRYLEKV